MIIVSIMVTATSCHSHNYNISTVKNSTCTEVGIYRYTCDCGDTFETENPRLAKHTFSEATCENPQICVTCGLTNGTPLKHNFENNLCIDCNTPPINLTFDTSEKTIKYFTTNNETITCKINKLSYEANYNSNGNIDIVVFWSGEKLTSDANVNSIKGCHIGYALYAYDGYVIACGYDSSINLRPGDKFKNESFKITDLPINGTYTLIIFDYMG